MAWQSLDEIEELLSRAGEPAKKLAPPGYLAKGVLYVVVGLMAADAALHPGEALSGAGEAIREIRTQPLGLVAAGLLLLGLSAYVLWQLARAIADPEGRAEGLRGIGFRVATLTVAIVYGALVWQSLDLLRGDFSASEARSTARWLGGMLENPVGRIGVVALGVGVVVFGLSQMYRTVHAETFASAQHPWLSRAGYAARGVLSTLIGWFIFRGGLQYAPGEFRDLEEVLAAVRDQPFGNALLFALAAGLVAYGLLQLARARIWQKYGSG